MTPANLATTIENQDIGLAPPGDYREFQLTVEEIAQETQAFMEARLGDLRPSEIEVLAVEVYGSRTTGHSDWGSDLDVKVFYQGTLREDDAFNLLNEEPLVVYGLFDGRVIELRVDINLIKT